MLAFLCAALSVAASPARADDEPATGMFLIANPELTGSWFSKTVILLIQHDPLGTVGVIINRPTDTAPADLMPEIDGIGNLTSTLYLGGPVERYGVTMLVRSAAPPEDAEHVFADVYASGSQQLLLEIINGDESTDRIRLYAGYAGWTPGQLNQEIERGSWTVVPASEKFVFASDPGEVWKRLAPPSKPIIVRGPGNIVRF